MLVALVLLAACSGSDPETSSPTTTAAPAADADPEGFCEQVGVFSELSDASDGEITDEQLERFDAIAEVAPAEIVDDLEVIADTFRKLASIDPDAPDAFEQTFTVVLDESFLTATERVEEATLEECGIDISAGDDESGATDDLGAPDVPEDDPFGDAPGSTDDPLGLDAFDDALAAAGYPWADDVVGKSLSSSGDTAEVTIDLADRTPASAAEEACQAALDHFAPLVDELVVTVSVGGEPTVTAEGGTCAAVA